jgi:hypothetical protein
MSGNEDIVIYVFLSFANFSIRLFIFFSCCFVRGTRKLGKSIFCDLDCKYVSQVFHLYIHFVRGGMNPSGLFFFNS